jgi:hypothetical protein
MAAGCVPELEKIGEIQGYQSVTGNFGDSALALRRYHNQASRLFRSS